MQGTPGLTWTDVDAIFVIVRSASSTNFTWPFAKSRQVTIKVKSGGKDVDHKVARVCMPHDQTTTVKFTDVAVSAHELGHTFGLDDQYMPATDPNFTDAMRTRELGQRELGEVYNEALALPTLQNLPPGVRLADSGDAEMMQELFGSFGLAMGIGVLCIYMVLVLLFRGFTQPVTILAALPLAIGGAFVVRR